jgi:hypothetical protein
MAVRARTARAVNLTAELTRDQKIAKMKSDLNNIVLLSREESEARSAKEKATKKLEKDMAELSVGSIQIDFDSIVYEGKIWAGDPSNVVDITKLASLVSPAQFLTVISAPSGAVKDAFGTNILNQTLVEKHGEVKLRIGKLK